MSRLIIQKNIAWPLSKRQQDDRFQAGFSLVELMTVISLAALVLAVTFPVFNSINRGTRIASSVNLLKGAMASTQMHATREVADKEVKGEVSPVPFRGGALVIDEVVDGNEVRLQLQVMEHYQEAKGDYDGAGQLLETYPIDDPDDGGPKKGFIPMGGIDPVNLPVGVGMVGVVRQGNASVDGLKFIWPPFAIHFDQRGKIIAGRAGTMDEDADIEDADNRVVLIDANGNGDFGEREDGDSPKDKDFHGSNDVNEILTTVTYILLFDQTRFEAAGFDSSTLTTDLTNQDTNAVNERTWLRANGKLLHMNRFSGVIMRENGIGETLVRE